MLFFVDNNPKKYDQLVKLSHKGKEANFAIKNPKEILNTDFDKIYITSLTGCDSILKQLSSYGVDMLKVDYIYSRVKIDARVNFLKSFSKDCKDKKLFGEVAELGVFQGEFAKEIHKFFPDKKLYLFDTFEGFDERDLQKEDEATKKMGTYLDDTSVELVLSKMKDKSKIIIKKGYFPDSASGLDEESFCFVNLDVDLYQPIKSGLEFFYPKLCTGGIILIHDYYNPVYPGVKKAVDEFCEKHKINCFPIGDDISVALQKA